MHVHSTPHIDFRFFNWNVVGCNSELRPFYYLNIIPLQNSFSSWTWSGSVTVITCTCSTIWWFRLLGRFRLDSGRSNIFLNLQKVLIRYKMKKLRYILSSKIYTPEEMAVHNSSRLLVPALTSCTLVGAGGISVSKYQRSEQQTCYKKN